MTTHYAVVPVDRNDESCLFALEIKQHHLRSLRLFPALIAGYQVRRARGARGDAIAWRLQSLCAALQTMTRWNAAEGAV